MPFRRGLAAADWRPRTQVRCAAKPGGCDARGLHSSIRRASSSIRIGPSRLGFSTGPDTDGAGTPRAC